MDGMIDVCPECGAELVSRLGILECTECSYMTDTAEHAAQDRKSTSGRSYRDPRTDRHNLGELLTTKGSRQDRIPRATRGRR